MEIMTIRKEATINGKAFPMFIGYASAEDILKFAYVPSFAATKEHHKIAAMLYKTPVDEWQRPLDTPVNRTDVIKGIFSDTKKQNLMCNPVLLGLSNQISATVSVIPKLAAGKLDGKVNMDIFILELNAKGGKKPLWIIDGQHRLHGLEKSTQKTNPVPMVFLVEENKKYYDETFMAEVFTQVTSGAEPLHSLHQFWMEYCFNMGNFASHEFKEAFDFAKELCSETNLPKQDYPKKGDPKGPTNDFANKIKFNPYDDDYGYRTIRWTVSDWTDLVYDEYYGNSPKTKLDYQALAVNFSHFIRAAEKLDAWCKGGTSRLFCAAHSTTTVVKAMITEYFRFIAKDDTCNAFTQSEWEDFLKDSSRSFNSADWALTKYWSAKEKSSTYGAGVNHKGLHNMFHHMFRGTVTADPVSHLAIKSPSKYFQGTAHPRAGTPPKDRWGTAKTTIMNKDFPGSAAWDITAKKCKGVKFLIKEADFDKSNVTMVKVTWEDASGKKLETVQNKYIDLRSLKSPTDITITVATYTELTDHSTTISVIH